MTGLIDPSALMLSIRSGAMDDRLDEISRWIRLRREAIQTDLAAQVEPGDQVVLTNISPQYLDGAVVEIIGFDGDMTRGKLLSHTGRSKYPVGKVLLLRRSHIGAVRKKED